MSFPWIFAEGFEAGTRGGFTAETDTTSILDFPHFSVLSEAGMSPYRGAYSMRIRPNGGTTDAYVQEDDDFDDIDATGIDRYLRWYFYLGRDLVMADTDKFAMFNAESTLDTTVEVAAGIIRTSGNLLFWYAETNASAATTIMLGPAALGPDTALGKWYCAELFIEFDNAANNDGAITGYINDRAGGTVSSLNQADIVDVKFGVIGPDAGTSGTILIDDIIYDDGRIYQDRERFPLTFTATKSEHVFVGPGCIDSAALLSAAADDAMRVYDTDAANSNDAQGTAVELDSNNTLSGPFQFTRGCYVVLSGTNPRGKINLTVGSDRAFFGPPYYSHAGMVNYGHVRKARGPNL